MGDGGWGRLQGLITFWNTQPKLLRQPSPHQLFVTQTDSVPLLGLSSRHFHSKLKLFHFHQSFPPYYICACTSVSSLASWPGSRYSSHCHYHSRHSLSSHLFMPVPVNKSTTVMAVYRHTEWNDQIVKKVRQLLTVFLSQHLFIDVRNDLSEFNAQHIFISLSSSFVIGDRCGVQFNCALTHNNSIDWKNERWYEMMGTRCSLRSVTCPVAETALHCTALSALWLLCVSSPSNNNNGHAKHFVRTNMRVTALILVGPRVCMCRA